MGTRLTVISNGDEYFGNHKFYMYQDFDRVKNSFEYLFPIMLEQNFMDCVDIYGTAEEYYDTFCVYGSTDDLLLSEEQFKEFAKLYAEELINTYGAEATKYITDALENLCNQPGPKTLYWG